MIQVVHIESNDGDIRDTVSCDMFSSRRYLLCRASLNFGGRLLGKYFVSMMSSVSTCWCIFLTGMMITSFMVGNSAENPTNGMYNVLILY